MYRSIIIRPEKPYGSRRQPLFSMRLQGFHDYEDQEIRVKVYRIDPVKPDQEVASFTGAARADQSGMQVSQNYRFELKSNGTAHDSNKPSFGLVFAPGSSEPEVEINFPGKGVDKNEGDSIEFQLRIDEPETLSPKFVADRPRRSITVEAPKKLATYRWHAGNSAAFFHDGGTGALRQIGQAMSAAKHFIFIVDWSFHPMMRLTPDQNLTTVGRLLIERAREKDGPLVAIHTWNHPDPRFLPWDEANDDGLKEFDVIAGGSKPPNLLWRASSRSITPSAVEAAIEAAIPHGSAIRYLHEHWAYSYSHHQKFVVLDCKSGDGSGRRDLQVFFGGLDLTKGRFDNGDHEIGSLEASGTVDRYPQAVDGIAYSSCVIRKSGDPFRTDWTGGVIGIDGVNHVIQSVASGDKLYLTPTEENRVGPVTRHHSGGSRAELSDEITIDFTKPVAAGQYYWRWKPFGPFNKELTLRSPDYNKTYNDWYNAEFTDDLNMPRQPWHDIHATLTGPAAWDFVREFVGRWNQNVGVVHLQGDTDPAKVNALFLRLFDKTKFLQQWEYREPPEKSPWTVQVYRSLDRDHWGGKLATPVRDKEMQWTVAGDSEASIQHAYLEAIRTAERFIYIENQYFIGSGGKWGRSSVANQVPETIVKRILEKKGQGFHAYIVTPMFPEGPPDGLVAVGQRTFEWKTVEYMVKAVSDATGGNWQRYLSFYFPAKWHDVGQLHLSGPRKERVALNRRYMIYVHAKMMMVDDRYIILGSANLNERSQNGHRDSEIAAGFWPSGAQTVSSCEAQLREFRLDIWAEHFAPQAAPQDPPESEKCAAEFRQKTDENYIWFRRGKNASGSGHLCRWPIVLRDGKLHFDSGFSSEYEGDQYLPDAPLDSKDKYKWTWLPGMEGGFGLGETLVNKALDLAE